MTQTQGLVLVTGPTGSGKTISLYSALALLNSEEKISQLSKILWKLKYQVLTKLILIPRLA
nr:ATPase, T2SS/T4P/T4SS family [Legionella tunisiensis]